MTTPLPQGLIRVVSATQTEDPSDPADVVYQRKQALHKFWQVHDAQSRATHEASSIRCRQLFWRVWGDRRLSVSLSQNAMMSLWLQCQRDFDLSPFELRIESSSSSAFQSGSCSPSESSDQRLPRELQTSLSPGSTSSTQALSGESSYQESSTDFSKQHSKLRTSSKTADPRPGINRTLSGEPGRKRSNVTTGTIRGKARPSMPRKRSSQAGPSNQAGYISQGGLSTQPAKAGEDTKPRKSIMKSPRTSAEEQTLITESRNTGTTSLAEISSPSATTTELANRRISTFELPPASSWQSIESHAGLQTTGVAVSTSQARSPLLIDKNFREKFQDQLRSSTNLAGMTKAMRRTGSVVRFADEVDMPEDFRKLKGAVRQKDLSTPQTVGESSRRTAFEGHKAQSDTEKQDHPWRPPGIERHHSVGSVAAVSDEESDGFDAGDVAGPIPRTKSQLSIAIADLKRSQSLSEQEVASSYAVTSPKIEEGQEALISGKQGKKPTEDELKLLAMGRKDGVTKAGGANLPKALTVKGVFEVPGDGYESPEEPLY